MRNLTVKEQQEINGGGLLLGAGIVILIGVCGSLGFYNGKKDTDLQYSDKE